MSGLEFDISLYCLSFSDRSSLSAEEILFLFRRSHGNRLAALY